MKAKNVKVGVKVIVKSKGHTTERHGWSCSMLELGDSSVIGGTEMGRKSSVRLKDGYLYDIRDLKRVKKKVKVAVEDEICFSVGDKVQTGLGEFEVMEKIGQLDLYACYQKGFDGHACGSVCGSKYMGTMYEGQMFIFSSKSAKLITKGDK